MMPSGIKYNKAIKVVSSASRSTKNTAVMDAISIKASRYCQRRDRNEKLCMFAIVPVLFGAMFITFLKGPALSFWLALFDLVYNTASFVRNYFVLI
jgi:hypothetical protein